MRASAGDNSRPFLAAQDRAMEPGFSEVADGFQEQVVCENGQIFQGDSLRWLKSLPDSSVHLVIADPPYNINKAVWDKFDSDDHYIEWSLEWIEQASRVLVPDGSLYICGFSEILADLKKPSMNFFKGARWLVWHYRNKANLGSDWGRSHESILHLRKASSSKLKNPDFLRIPYGAHTKKYPQHPQALTSNFGKGQARNDDWQPHPMGAKGKDIIEVPTLSNGMSESTPHPTQKPEELIRKLIWASSNPGEVVVDPFSGSGTTAVCAEQLARKWLACEQSGEYNSWAAKRLASIESRSEKEWFEFDALNRRRRDSIR